MDGQSAREAGDSGMPLAGERRVLELIATGARIGTILEILCCICDEQSGLQSSISVLNGAGEPLHAGFGEGAREEDIHIAWSTPIISTDQRPLGTFTVYSREAGPLSAAKRALIGRATYLASIAVERHWADNGGRPGRDRAIGSDITDRHRVDEQLRTSERLLAEAQRLAHIGSWNWDLTSRIVTWSDELYRIFGFEPHGIDPGREAMTYVRPDERAAIMSAIQRTLQTKEPYNLSYGIQRRDGSARMLHSIGYLVSNHRGEPVSIFGCTQDVTERTQAEEALRRSEQLLRLVLDAIPVGVVVVDPEGDIILNNPASRRIWAGLITRGPERYARSKAWWHHTGKPLAREEWASYRALAHGETVINDVIEIAAFDGDRKIIHNSAVPIRDEHQALVGAVVINEDVSAHKRAERDLEASVNQMQMLAARLIRAQDDERRRIAKVLHETTAQDLAALKMLLMRLSRTAGGLSDADRALLAESVQLAEHSISEARTLAYLLHPPFLDDAGLLSAVRWYAQGFAHRSGIQVDLDLPNTLQRLPQDVETTLFRVVQEALINIHRHASSETARLSLRLEARHLTLEIRDSGLGIPPRLLMQLRAGAGALGVGLAGLRERLKQIGGRLEIDSSDKGTVVCVTVPVRRAGRRGRKGSRK